MRAGVFVAVAFAALAGAVSSHAAPPPGATALCRDGTYSFSQHHSGTCSSHGGVAVWLDGSGPAAPVPAPAPAPAPAPPALGSRTKSGACRVFGALQDSACTPGGVFADATAAEVCVPGYSSSVRNVSESTKRAVYREYGIATHAPGQYEVDHLISLELGGSNDIANLWPEAASPRPGFREKDKVENYLHAQVCKGAISLTTAQQLIAGNWLSVYRTLSRRRG